VLTSQQESEETDGSVQINSSSLAASLDLASASAWDKYLKPHISCGAKTLEEL
jgi:hypothetical protein